MAAAASLPADSPTAAAPADFSKSRLLNLVSSSFIAVPPAFGLHRSLAVRSFQRVRDQNSEQNRMRNTTLKRHRPWAGRHAVLSLERLLSDMPLWPLRVRQPTVACRWS